MHRPLGWMLGLAVGVALSGPVWAQVPSVPSTNPEASAPVYVPPLRGAPSVRVSGGTRGTRVHVLIDVIAPNEIGQTTRDQPTLYWFNSAPIGNDVEITLVADDTNKTALDVTIPGPIEAGIHAFRLAGTPTRLDPQTVYQWSVTAKVSTTDPSEDIVASGMVQRVAPTKVADPVPADAVGAVDAYARSGMWYDAIETLSHQIEQKPNDSILRSYRSALMMQVGLGEVAAFDNKTKN
jgi:hypothetical protein